MSIPSPHLDEKLQVPENLGLLFLPVESTGFQLQNSLGL